jgi:2-amino-4-hydroxy-6-hydroxymethyldihydropteridine diphosphokinase
VVALGSNIEDRIHHLCFGLRSLREAGIALDVVSSVFETPPVGFLHQPPFLNMVALGATHLPPERVLSIFQRIEREAGRTPGKRNAPRTLDLDLLFYEDWIVRERDLTVPHPRWRGRSFVVVPLAEIAPGLRDPETGWQVKEIARYWPLEPGDIRAVLAPEGIQKECEE